MKAIACAVLLLASVVSFAQSYGYMEISLDGQAARIVNNTERFMFCEVVVSGRSAYWELYPGQTTAWYKNINWWRCQ